MLVGTPSIDFSEKGNETQLIYSGLVLLDQPSQGFNQFTKMPKWKQKHFHLQITRWANPSSIPYKPKKLSNSCSKKREKWEIYVMITNWSDYTSFNSLQMTSLNDRENMFLKFLREREIMIWLIFALSV